jgi:hypothetical protein
MKNRSLIQKNNTGFLNFGALASGTGGSLLLVFLFLFCLCETKSHYIAQTGLELTM